MEPVLTVPPLKERPAWWRDTVPLPPARPPLPPANRAAQWILPGDAVWTDTCGEAIVTGNVSAATAGPAWARKRILTWVILDGAGVITAVGRTVKARGTLVRVTPARSLGHRIAAQENLVAGLEGDRAALDAGWIGWADIAPGLTCPDRTDAARDINGQDLDAQRAVLGRLLALRTAIADHAAQAAA